MCFQCLLPFFSRSSPLPDDDSASLLQPSQPPPTLQPHDSQFQPSLYVPPSPQLIQHSQSTSLPIHDLDTVEPSPKEDVPHDHSAAASALPSVLSSDQSQHIEATKSKHKEPPQQLLQTSHSSSLPSEDAPLLSVSEAGEKPEAVDQPPPAAHVNSSQNGLEHAESGTSVDIDKYELPEHFSDTSSSSEDTPFLSVSEVDEKPELENEVLPNVNYNSPQYEYYSSTSSPSQPQQKHRHRHRLSQHLNELRQQMKEEGNRLHNFYSGAKQQITEIRSVLSHSESEP